MSPYQTVGRKRKQWIKDGFTVQFPSIVLSWKSHPIPYLTFYCLPLATGVTGKCYFFIGHIDACLYMVRKKGRRDFEQTASNHCYAGLFLLQGQDYLFCFVLFFALSSDLSSTPHTEQMFNKYLLSQMHKWFKNKQYNIGMLTDQIVLPHI